MISLFIAIAAAQAAPPSTPALEPVPVDAVRWAQPFVLEEPVEWTMSQDQRSIETGWIVELEAPAALLAPRSVGQRVLYADGAPVRPLHSPLVATCTVVVVPGDRVSSIDDVRFYFGSTELPERVDAARGARELRAAIDAGIAAVAPLSTAPAVRVADLSALAQVTESRFQACRAPDAPPTDQPPSD